jgi:GMP synthase-like glutamine amidotransferase
MNTSDDSSPLRALVVQHEDSAPGGYVGEWLEERGADQDLYRIYADERSRVAGDYDLIVTLGSASAAYDDTIPWVERELRLLSDASEHDVPVLGICFGGQILARALGGRAFRNERAEIGWRHVRSSDQSLVPGGPWFQWHFDAFTAPPVSRLIAENAIGPQAFVAGRCLGLQFHPEVTPEIVRWWATSDRDELEREGVDPEALVYETSQLERESRAAALRLFDSFLQRVADGRYAALS